MGRLGFLYLFLLPGLLGFGLSSLPHPIYLELPTPTHNTLLCLIGDISYVCFRGILVLWVPRERQALWVLQAQQENLVLMV